jgi:hypothetical protein
MKEKYQLLKRDYLILSLLGSLLIIICWPGNFFFLNDDFVHIPLSGEGILGQNNSVRFIGDISLMADYAIYKKNASGYHITNLLLHFINVILFGFILLKVLPSAKKSLAIIVMAGFAFYGFHSEAIFWIIGRSASLGFLFLSIGILLLVQNRVSLLMRIGYFTCWILALYSYESVWIWVPAITFLYFKKNDKTNNPDIPTATFIGTWMIFIAYLISRKVFTQSWLGEYEAQAFEKLNVLTLATNYCKLIFRTFIPPLNNAYGYIISFAGLTLIPIYAIVRKWNLYRQDKLWKWGVLFWLVSYFPYLSLGISINTPESERFLYLPSVLFVFLYFYTATLYLQYSKKWVFDLIAAAFLFCHFSWFVKSAREYHLTGQLVKQTFKVLCNETNIESCTIQVLPHTVYGIPTFRSGFEEGYNWLCSSEKKISNLKIQKNEHFSDANYRFLRVKNDINASCQFLYIVHSEPLQ